ncbi:GIN domain-containing protein [Pseudoduganella namucuonensis]|uniref:Putative auto-transporter adhesin, head GIN domain n=1 Tax=Pseudoduganella namucuonensis TaxID=1035707 RepID=A0A1I7LL49_9BURK|nr:DUF2807 domain-containing protein [Pseudoduganella namucuonensis]SFV10359.1 Putative auto-transporter adhesin, head GIN domain [Pseudoduganella namucuonensis]
MNKFFSATMMAVSLYAAHGLAIADEVVSEVRNIDGRAVKVVLDGVINLKLKQGGNASLVVSGDKRHLSKVTVTQNGDTLRIGTDLRGVHMGNTSLNAELTLPDLRELVSAGVGSAEVSGFTGDAVRLALEGAGSVNLVSRYRVVNARLTGVGSMNVNAGESEQVDLNLRGAGQIVISGQSRNLRATLGGIGSLDAQRLRADSVDVDLSGLGGATVYAKNSASLRLTGLGSATVYGKPANRNASSRGLGSVAWN